MVSDLLLIILLITFQSIYFTSSIISRFLEKRESNFISQVIRFRSLIALLVALIAWGEFFFLISIITQKNTNYVLVNYLISEDMSLEYRFFATWSNSAGTLLLWFCFLATIQVIAEFLFYFLEKQNQVIIIISLFSLFILLGLLFENPFEKEINPSFSYGIAPALRSPYIAIHPILSFLAYTLALLVYAIYASKSKVTDDLLKKIRIINGITSFSLGFTIITGAIWSYEVLWGGHWTWDIIEVLSLMIFLFSILPYHLKKNSLEIQMLSFGLTFPSILFSTFIIRSGLIFGLHSYATSTTSIFFFLLFVVSLYPFRTLRIHNELTIDLTFTDNGNSLWLLSFLVIILIFIISIGTLISYNIIARKFINPPIHLYHLAITTLLIFPLLITITCELHHIFSISKRKIHFVIIFLSLAYIFITSFSLTNENLSNTRGYLFGLLPLISIIITNNRLKQDNKAVIRIHYKHITRIAIHLLFLLFIYSLLITHYSEIQKTTIMEEDNPQLLLNKSIQIIGIDYQTESEIGEYPWVNSETYGWKLIVDIKIDGKQGTLVAGWNQQHGYFSIPVLSSSWFSFYQVSLKFIAKTVFYAQPMDNKPDTTEYLVIISVRLSIGGYITRIIQYLFSFSMILPALNRMTPKENDFYS